LFVLRTENIKSILISNKCLVLPYLNQTFILVSFMFPKKKKTIIILISKVVDENWDKEEEITLLDNKKIWKKEEERISINSKK
jgi:hypothetical protein